MSLQQNRPPPDGAQLVLLCVQVGWVKADTKAIQAIHLTVVTHNPRVSVEHAGPSQWKLVIKNVRKEDAGAYMCQINTDPMKSQVKRRKKGPICITCYGHVTAIATS